MERGQYRYLDESIPSSSCYNNEEISEIDLTKLPTRVIRTLGCKMSNKSTYLNFYCWSDTLYYQLNM